MTRATLAALVARLHPALLRFFRARTDSASADDLAQATWLRCCLADRRAEIGPGLVFRAAERELSNERRHWVRRDSRTASFSEMVIISEHLRENDTGWEPAACDADPCLFDDLSEQQRVAIWLTMAGYTIAETAEQMGLTFKQARGLIDGARATIRGEG